jgi:phosphate:Na+ symporter
VCLLLWGVGMVSAGLNRAFGAQLRRVISNSTSNRFKAFGVGALVTLILQSSTAASMIVSSFAARNVVTIPAALAVMLGADVGTTLAAQALSLNLKWLIPVLLTSGYLVNKTLEANQYKHVGRALVGVALVLVSLAMIKTVAEPLKQSEALHLMLSPLAAQPLLAIALSTLMTWLAHSSLGMVLLFMSFVHAGTINVDLGFLLVLGANIGGVLAPVVMTLRDIPAGRRVPLGNLVTRIVGVLVCVPLLPLITPLILDFDPSPARALVNFHTVFNIALALAFLPFVDSMTRLSEIVLPDRPREEDESLPRFLDPTAFASPPAALACASRETMRISDIVQKMMRLTLEAFRTNNARLVTEIRDLEGVLDSLYDAIKNYLARLSTEALDPDEGKRCMLILTFSTNLEHVGDIIDKNLMEMAASKIQSQDNFSRQGFAEISELHARVMNNILLAQHVFMTADARMAHKLLGEKSVMREQEMGAAEKHFKRLSAGVAETIATSRLHLDILRDLRRINSYIALVAYPVLEQVEGRDPRPTSSRSKTARPKAKSRKPSKNKKLPAKEPEDENT